jgi:hypothetical protein
MRGNALRHGELWQHYRDGANFGDGRGSLHRNAAAYPNRPVATVMNLQFAALIPNYYMLEMTGSSEMPFSGGSLCIPSGAGSGMSLDQDALARHPYMSHDGWR